MNCQNFESIVDDLAREQIMEANARAQALLHSASCASCSMKLQKEQALTDALRELKARMGGALASNEIEERVSLEFRNYHQAIGVDAGNAARAALGGNRSRWSYWNYAAAAGILLAVTLGVAANRYWRSAPPIAPVANFQEVVAPKERVGVDNVAIDSSVEDSIPDAVDNLTLPGNIIRPVKHRSRARFRVARSTVTVQSLSILAPEAEVTTGFIPIGYSSPSNVSEGGQVVRLELSRYAMARFGVPVNEERYDQRVKADVWIGADGLARAIRFVQ